MHRWKVASALCKPNSCTRLATQPGMPPGTTCSPTSKDTTIVSGFIPPSGISPPNRQSAKLLNPMSTKSREGHTSTQRQSSWGRTARALPWLRDFPSSRLSRLRMPSRRGVRRSSSGGVSVRAQDYATL